MDRRLCVFISAVILSGIDNPSAAQPVNCDSISHSKIPFQITMSNRQGRDFFIQVYRSDNLYRVEFSNNRGIVSKSVFQANFPLEVPGIKDTKLTLTYNIPTAGYTFDRGVSEAEVTVNDGTKSTTRTNHYKSVGVEDLIVGPCVFHSQKYTIEIDTDTILLKNTIWMSPEINAILKTETSNTFKQGGRITAVSTQATDITTDFVPLK